MREAGRRCAQAYPLKPSRRPRLPESELRLPDPHRTAAAAMRTLDPAGVRWIVENARLIRTAAKDCRALGQSLRRHPGVADGQRVLPRAFVVARDYLDAAAGRFTEESLAEFVAGYQEIVELEMGELWALRPALQYLLVQRLSEQNVEGVPILVRSLRQIADAQWKEWFESVSKPDQVLGGDPACAYAAMDYESRDLYRKALSGLARHSGLSESEVAAAAVRLAGEPSRFPAGSCADLRRRHVGYYLIGDGLEVLREAVGYRQPPVERFRNVLFRNSTGFYLGGVEMLTFVIVGGLLAALGTLTPIVAGFFMLVLPASQAAVNFMNTLVAYLTSPRVLPKLDFSKGIPGDCATMVAVPTLLLNERQVRDLVLDLEIRFLANRDPNLYFALLTDSPDSDQPVDERDKLTGLCGDLIRDLNRRYRGQGHSPFLLLHRHRMYNASEGRWMGWERKRGKLLDLNQLLRNGADSFPVKVGDTSVFSRIRYVITLDSDTQLPRDSAARLVGAMAHPLNRAVIDPVSMIVVEGYGILQPRVGVSVESASRSRLAGLYSGQTGFDIYTRAISDVYQDLFGEGIFTGKGIYDVDALCQVLEGRFPDNALLSHDLIEGAYARAALVSDIELIDGYPSHFSAHSRRKHRWVRGDWQIMRWLLSRVPDAYGHMIRNPISVISRWKILDNLRRSLIEPATLLLFLAGWFYLPGKAAYWTGASVAMLAVSVYSGLIFSVLRPPSTARAVPAWAREMVAEFVKGNIVTLLGIVFLLHHALLSLDAIGRSVLRVLVTRRKLLEWETAAEAESQSRRKATVDIYLEWTPVLAAAIAAALWLVRPASLPVAWPVLVLWFLSRFISSWLNRAPRTTNRKLTKRDAQLLTDSAASIWRFYHEWSTPATNWLIPDNVTEDGAAAQRVSPTNAGLLLNARIAALQFGFIGMPQFVRDTLQSLERLQKLEKARGHLLNWYDTETLQPLEPRFVSTVDSGNLAACLWTLKQAAAAFAAEREHAAFVPQLEEIRDTCHRMVAEMDFSFLYDARRKVLSVGYDAARGRREESSYDLLASESRIACFVAIAKGDIPQQAWFHLGRTHTVARGNRVLLSWTGTMFEYLMPALWMRHHHGTILEQSLKAVVRVQQDYGRRRGVPWGISESACTASHGSEYGYAAFGIPALAVKYADREDLVISPYSSFLALLIDPKGAVDNLRTMLREGWSGRYGFYEAVDYSKSGEEPIRSWMAHHLGMSLLAICNVLYSSPFERYFHAEPQVMATELLLDERVPAAVTPDPEPAPEPVPLAVPAATQA